MKESYLEHWIKLEIIDEEENILGHSQMFYSKLPVAYIDTEGGESISSKEVYINASLNLQGNAKYVVKDTRILKISKNGKIQVKKSGKIYIIVTCNGLKKKIQVRVKR